MIAFLECATATTPVTRGGVRSTLPILPALDSGNQRLPSGPTVRSPGEPSRAGSGNSVRAPAGVIRPIAPCSESGLLGEPEVAVGADRQSRPGMAIACRERELGDGARRRDPADRGTGRRILGEPEVAVGADRQVGWDAIACRERELGDGARRRDPADRGGPAGRVAYSGNQRLPSGPTVRSPGRGHWPAGSGNSVMAPAGVIRPIAAGLPHTR